MSPVKEHTTRLERLIRRVFSELGGVDCVWQRKPDGAQAETMLVSGESGRTYALEFKVRERITPQIADELFSRLEKEPPPTDVVRIVYAPVISPRVAEIAQQHGISFIDYAGNCRIINPSAGLLISRSGIQNDASMDKQTIIDPFSPKSSRIVRAMLHEPNRGWQVSELAEHPDVRVSVGLVSKVKQALVRESYAVIRDRLLYLKQPLDLLTAWSKAYPGPVSQHPFYVRGDTQEVERKMSNWCEQSNIEYALARFSAAWRLAPEVRYSVASMYVNSEALQLHRLESLREECGAKQVESGENLVLLIPYDQSVFVRRTPTPERTTSPLQSYLDLRSMAGRGSEAADAIFEKHLREALESAGAESGIT